MAAPTDSYVDPSINADTGVGTSVGDPAGDLQGWLNRMTRDATNGDRVNIKAGMSEILTGSIDYTTYGTPSFTAPLIFQGYTSAAGDGGQGVLDGNAGNFTISAGKAAVHFRDLHLTNTGTAYCLTITSHQSAIGCEFSESTGGGITGTTSAACIGCDFHDITGIGANSIDGVSHCYFKNGASKKFTQCITSLAGATIVRNFMTIDGASVGIGLSSRAYASNNSILSSSGTGQGLHLAFSARAENNLIEGFSGAGGIGIHVESMDITFLSNNAIFNCTTTIDYSGVDLITGSDNETLSVTGFAKSGADTFANRFAYFAPVDTGNVRGGAYPSGSNLDKGAVQSAGGSTNIINRRGNSLTLR